jgi:pyrroline-5-carboxylate reductase
MGDRIVLAGCGNMGHAMLSGWIAAKAAGPEDIFVVEPNGDLLARAKALGVAVSAQASDIPAGFSPALIIFAVKPQVIREVAAQYRRFADDGTTFLSIAAGTPISTFEAVLGTGARIVRSMPNTPAAIGKGMLVTFAKPNVPEAARALIARLLNANGKVAEIADEALMDAVTAVSGSGPAYVFYFIECLTQAAVHAGLPADTAKLLAMQTVHGAAALAAQSGEEPGRLREQVTSPNGTTAAALKVLMGADGLEKLVVEAVEAARLRSIELGK